LQEQFVRTLFFDQFEFDSFSSEEELHIWVATKKAASLPQFADRRAFVTHCVGAEAATGLGSPMSFRDQAGFSSVRAYLKRFANIDVPEPCGWAMYVLLDEGLEWDGVFESDDMFIRYRWSSTA
jgi:hypothetical protein